jgi:hypothetical protein
MDCDFYYLSDDGQDSPAREPALADQGAQIDEASFTCLIVGALRSISIRRQSPSGYSGISLRISCGLRKRIPYFSNTLIVCVRSAFA